jgi:hypothetical protein
LRRRIEFDPDLFVAQERVEHSTAPACGTKDSLVAAAGQPPRLSRGGRPGRLLRHARRPRRASRQTAGKFISMQRGGSSKDTWIPSATPVEELPAARPGQNVELRRTGNNLPSRLADNFFWLGRYSERADATSRLLRSALLRFNPERTGGALPHARRRYCRRWKRKGQMPGIPTKPELWQNRRSVRGGAAGGYF